MRLSRPVTRGSSRGCSAPNTYLDAHPRNFAEYQIQSADKPATKPSTPYRIHMLPLLNRRGWTQMILKNDRVCQGGQEYPTYSKIKKG
jgi:hypothetical protein